MSGNETGELIFKQLSEISKNSLLKTTAIGMKFFDLQHFAFIICLSWWVIKLPA